MFEEFAVQEHCVNMHPVIRVVVLMVYIPPPLGSEGRSVVLDEVLHSEKMHSTILHSETLSQKMAPPRETMPSFPALLI